MGRQIIRTGPRRVVVAALSLLVGASLLSGGALASDVTKSHGLSAFGDLRYSADFKQFDYVNPKAPKGGTLRLRGIDSFDNLNGFILKGVAPEGLTLLHATLMERATDEPDAVYGYVAHSVEYPADKSWISFHIRPEARFNDGSRMTAEDVVFTFNILIKKGHPQYRVIFTGVEKVEALSPSQVKFTFKQKGNRDLLLQVASLPVLSKAYYAGFPFDKTTMTPPLSAGPYVVDKVEPGRDITYRRVANHWARNLPIMKGRFNFDRVQVDYYRDRDIAFQAFFAGAYDFREEFTSRNWATQYTDKLPIKKKLVVRKTLPDGNPSGMQAFFFNMRKKDKFGDARVREAIDLAFDFEWTNKALFFSQYDRSDSMFENSELAAKKKPTADELALLTPLKGQVPEDVFTGPYISPRTDASGRTRRNLRKAAKLLKAAGWTIKNNQRVNAQGKILKVEFLLFERSFDRVINPFLRNLKRIGVEANIRVVDVANYQLRMQQFDFDVIIQRYVQRTTPGIELLNYFGSKAADIQGSNNLAGIKDPAIDHLIAKVINAKSRKSLIAATRALDRVLMWNHYSVPQWYKGVHNIAYWNKFDQPRKKPRFALGMIDTWWFNPKKAAMIADGKAPPASK